MLELIAAGFVDLLLAGLASAPFIIVMRRRRLQRAPASPSFPREVGRVAE